MMNATDYLQGLFAEPPIDVKANAAEARASEATTPDESEVVEDNLPANAIVGDASEVCEAVRHDGPQPCAVCASSVFWQALDGSTLCRGCCPQPAGGRKLLIVTIDGRNEWADYETERRNIQTK